ncbi:MAG TPA: PqqD family protein [Acidimicrobiales bacterium]|jgi:hypothetical protein|nr:PqqD family protein [Acidimicrobiales bacterium]
MRLQVRGDVEWRNVDGEIIVLDLGSSTYFSLNRTAAPLWRMLVEGATEQELVEALQGAHDLPSETAARDVAALVDELRTHDLLAS